MLTGAKKNILRFQAGRFWRQKEPRQHNSIHVHQPDSTQHKYFFSHSNKGSLIATTMSSFWEDVNGADRTDPEHEEHVAVVDASLRWWTSCGEPHQVKGRIVLQRFLMTPLFRFKYTNSTKIEANGAVISGEAQGTLYLPMTVSMPPIISRETLKSKHTTALGIRIAFSPNDDGIESLQLVIPYNSSRKAQMTAELMADAIAFAELERSRATNA